MTQLEAVFQACEELDVRTSGKTLQARAGAIYGDSIHYCTVIAYRSKYRKQYKIKADCRHYGQKGQWRRDMHNDHMATLPQVKRLNHYFTLKRPQVQALINLIGNDKDKFHSVEQLVNAVSELAELRKVA